MSLDFYTAKIRARETLSADEARAAFDILFSGAAGEEEVAQFLLALRDKGESVHEILGAARSMRSHMVSVTAPANTIDIVGTGGDGLNTPNISTAAAFVVAGCGVPVAKHGNRAATSKSGSSDVLAALGVNLEPSFGLLEECLATANLCFLFAPRHHPAMRHVVAVRKKLGVRTIFNLLGPLTNPANVTRHLIGVSDRRYLHPMALVLRALGSEEALITHGRDGMDELTLMDKSDAVLLEKGEMGEAVIDPEILGLVKPAPEEIIGGDAAQNAAMLVAILAGAKNAYRDLVTLNAGAALVVAGVAANLEQGLTQARESLDNGAARHILEKLITITNKV